MLNNCILEFDYGYCEIYRWHKDEFIAECHRDGKSAPGEQRRKPLEINLISRGRQGLELVEPGGKTHEAGDRAFTTMISAK